MILTSLDIISVLPSINNIEIDYSEPPIDLAYENFCFDIYEDKEVMKEALLEQVWTFIDSNELWSYQFIFYFLSIKIQHYITNTDRPDIFETKCIVKLGFDIK